MNAKATSLNTIVVVAADEKRKEERKGLESISLLVAGSSDRSYHKHPTMALYSRVEYWNERYQKSRNQPPYEWYQSFHTLSHLLNPETLSGCSVSASHLNLNNTPDNADDDASASTTAMTNATKAKAFQCLHPNNCRVLVLGCGNSAFGANLFEAGWRGGNQSDRQRFVQVDFSPVVIDQMKARYNDEYYRGVLGNTNNSKAHMEFLCCDVTQAPLPFENGSFDLIICKGVFDAVLCSAGSVFNIRRMVKECIRLLNDDGGVLMVVTYGNPDNRVVFLEDEEGELDTYWQGVSVHTVPSMVRGRKGGGHSGNKSDFVYLCRKKRGAWKESYALDTVASTSCVNPDVGTAARGTKDPESENQEGAKKAHSGATATNKKDTKMSGKGTKNGTKAA
ncbi:Endothelin-converting enzyme 2 [Seminavis robusta]|uniref:Endothelin-converting enzyme 2 n=1 Tax=Seminavis robusta TaxID=568900 RepID=A0A9N8HUD4_9STRA|nr:Endothelin-converting enzyme 2 [Seminavis robusta]|eukprot:Sro2049_g312520.1 Endothelin-converting enzyme 2 (393) ;mRNA; r:2038-4301